MHRPYLIATVLTFGQFYQNVFQGHQTRPTSPRASSGTSYSGSNGGGGVTHHSPNFAARFLEFRKLPEIFGFQSISVI